jgi:hypothetical protein
MGMGSTEQKKTVIVEKEDIAIIAGLIGAKKLLVVEMLPFKADFRQVLFYQAVKTTATFRVRLYDATEDKYVYREDILSQSCNSTVIPYTSVGKKSAVFEAVHKAVAIINQKVEQVGKAN